MGAPVGNKNHYKHGLSHSRIDNIYKSMIDRCENPNNHNYYKYGAKGIRVCEEWKEDKTIFFEWAFSHGYSPELTIDRKDNSLGYTPQNCRWVTYKRQNNNRSNNRIIEAFGERKTMAEWAEAVNIPYPTIIARIDRYGWNAERALSTKVRRARKWFGRP